MIDSKRLKSDFMQTWHREGESGEKAVKGLKVIESTDRILRGKYMTVHVKKM